MSKNLASIFLQAHGRLQSRSTTESFDYVAVARADEGSGGSTDQGSFHTAQSQQLLLQTPRLSLTAYHHQPHSFLYFLASFTPASYLQITQDAKNYFVHLNPWDPDLQNQQ